jgi:predicted HTH transcriptional regulator
LSELLGSFGNTEGGWAILGVEDDGTLVGLTSSRADRQDELRNRVQKTLDPPPNFAARREVVQRKEIGFVRVYPSEDTPLVSVHKGAPYIRLHGGNRPVKSRRELDVLIERGRSSDQDAWSASAHRPWL